MSKDIEMGLVPTDQLINELVKRYDSIVIAGIKHLDINGNYITYHNFFGNKFVCGWLCTLLTNNLFKLDQNKTKITGEI